MNESHAGEDESVSNQRRTWTRSDGAPLQVRSNDARNTNGAEDELDRNHAKKKKYQIGTTPDQI